MAQGEPALVTGAGMDDGIVGRELPRPVCVAASGRDDGVTGCRTRCSAFGNIQVEVAIMFDELRAFQADAFYPRRGGDRARFKPPPRRGLTCARLLGGLRPFG